MEQRLQVATQELLDQRVVPQAVLEGLKTEAAKERAELETMQKGGEVRKCVRRLRLLLLPRCMHACHLPSSLPPSHWPGFVFLVFPFL